jgi:hypothetical protein
VAGIRQWEDVDNFTVTDEGLSIRGAERLMIGFDFLSGCCRGDCDLRRRRRRLTCERRGNREGSRRKKREPGATEQARTNSAHFSSPVQWENAGFQPVRQFTKLLQGSNLVHRTDFGFIPSRETNRHLKARPAPSVRRLCISSTPSQA